MLVLIQVINHTLFTMEYDETYIAIHFEAILAGHTTAAELMDSLGIDTTGPQLERFMAALPKYESALAVVRLQNEVV